MAQLGWIPFPLCFWLVEATKETLMEDLEVQREATVI
jgi:hypothetical protein